MNLARSERVALCDELAARGPNAATLCQGWLTRDLATHLILRESDPVAGIGMFVPRFAAVTHRHAYGLSVRTPFPALVSRLRAGPPRLSPLAIPVLDDAMNLAEFFIHHEDIRRGGPDPQPARELPPGLADALWSRLSAMKKIMFSRAPVGVILERETGQRLRVRPGAVTVHVVGPVGELLLYASGRAAAARVDVFGESAAVTGLRTSLGL